MPVARLRVRGTNIDFHIFLPVSQQGQFEPTGFSSPWPLAYGHWDGVQYQAEMEYDEESSELIFSWNDNEVTEAQMPPELDLRCEHTLLMKSTRMKTPYSLKLGDYEIL